MRVRRIVALSLSAAVVGFSGLVSTSPAEAASKPSWTKNCTALNKKYPHGVGKAKARDKTSGKRVTTFKKSDKLYNTAMRYNRGLDRDKDGIACEKR